MDYIKKTGDAILSRCKRIVLQIQLEKSAISSRCLEIALQCRVENQKKPGGCF